MNDQSSNNPSSSPDPPNPAPPLGRSSAGAMTLEPFEKEPGFLSTFEAILRRPGSVIHHLQSESPGKLIGLLLLCSAACLVVFGFVVGTFSMGDQLWAAPLKIVGGLFFAGLICLPSLYIFSCLSGLEVRISSIAGILAAMICLASLLLVGFAPVVWIFSQSTDSVAFVGFLNLIVWIISMWFGLALMKNAASALGGDRRGHLMVWMVIFLMVTFQLTTTLRPIIGEPGTLESGEAIHFTSEKKFFLQHWFETLSGTADLTSRGRSAST